MQKASARLAKGTAVYMAGNLISRVLQMLILPLITAVLATEEYGDYDLIIASISLVMPIITMQMKYLLAGVRKQLTSIAKTS